MNKYLTVLYEGLIPVHACAPPYCAYSVQHPCYVVVPRDQIHPEKIFHFPVILFEIKKARNLVILCRHMHIHKIIISGIERAESEKFFIPATFAKMLHF